MLRRRLIPIPLFKCLIDVNLDRFCLCKYLIDVNLGAFFASINIWINVNVVSPVMCLICVNIWINVNVVSPVTSINNVQLTCLASGLE